MSAHKLHPSVINGEKRAQAYGQHTDDVKPTFAGVERAQAYGQHTDDVKPTFAGVERAQAYGQHTDDVKPTFAGVDKHAQVYGQRTNTGLVSR